MNMHDLLDAYRRGDRWIAHNASAIRTSRTRAGAMARLLMGDREWREENDTCWQLVREIAFRITGQTPWRESDPIQRDGIDGCTVQDLLLLPQILRRASRYDHA